MAEKERPLYTLYKGLKANNYDVPDNYDSFEKTLTEAGNGGANSRHALYNSLKEQNFDVPDTYEQFYSNLFTPVNKTTSRALGGFVPMSDADKARFSRNAVAISAQAGQAVQRFKNTQRASSIKKRQQKKQSDFGRVDLGTKKTAYGTENAVRDDFGIDQATGKVGTYITSSGEEIGNEYEAGQQQQAEDKYNAAYNDAVKSGEIPSTFDVVDKNGNYDLYENVGQNGTHVTEEGARRQLDAKIADATARLADINARIKEIDARDGNPLLSYSASIGAGSGASTERKQLGLARTQVENELRSLDAIQKQPDRNWLQNMWQGFSDTALTANAWDFGLNDFAVMGQMERIKAKADNNIPLTNEEKRLAQSKIGSDAAAALADEEMGRAYRWSGIAGQSVPFMFDFLVTGGFGGLTHAAGRAAVKFAAKKGMGTLGKNVLKYTGVTAANIVGSYAMAGTEQFFKTGADIMNRHLGTLYQDENGNYKFGTFDEKGNLVKDGGEEFGTALYKGLTAAMLENYTEKVFRHTHFKRAASKALSAHFPKFASFLATKGAPKWMKHLGIDGLGEEIMEEEINIPLNALLVGDNKLSDLGDLKQQGDIIFGIGLSVGSMYALDTIIPKGVAKIYNNAQYYRFKNKMDNVDSRLQQMMGDRWNEWKDKIDGTPNEEMGVVIRDVSQQKQSGSLNEQEINSIGDYISNLAKVRGYNLAKTTEVEAKAATGEETTPEDEHQQEQEQAYSEGQDAEGEEKHEIQMQTAEAEANLASMLGVSVEQMENVDLDSMLGENDQLDLAIYEYQSANARYQGVMDKAQSAVDSAEENARAEVQRRMDASRGTVRNATIKSASNDLNGGEDYGVYIVSGNVATNEDGTINVADSDDMILYFDPLTGKIEHADASRFSSLGEEVDAELTIQQTVELARQDAIAGVTRDIDGKVGEGSQFVVIDNQGQQHIYEVLADNGDGTAFISIDGNVMENVFPSFDELQKMKDDTDKMRVSDYVAERQAEREQQQQVDEQEKQKAEKKVKSIDWSQLIDPDGNITTATIEGEDKLAFVVGRTPSGKLRVAYLNDDDTVEKRKGLVSPDKVMLGEPIALDEYRQMMGDTNNEQSTNGEEIVDDASTKEVEDSGETGGSGSGIESKVVSDKDFDIDSNAQSSENVSKEKEAPKFSDGTPIPLDKDGEVDFSQMTPGQAVEWYDTNLGDDAQGVIDASVASAKKALDKAQKVSVKPAKPSEMVKARQEKLASIDAAQTAYDNAVAVSNAYNEMLLGRALETPGGRKSLLDKAKAKFDRLKNKDEWKNNQQALWNETIGNVLHRLYDGTGINVFDPVPLTIEEYVSGSLVPYSLNYEGTDTSKGVKQETGLERKDFAKSHVLAAEGKGMTVDAFVHKLWDNRPSQFDSATTQDIRAALLSLITSDMNAYDMRNVIQSNRIAEAERMLEDEKNAADNAAHQEEQKENAGVDTSAEEGTTPEEDELSPEETGTSEEQQSGEQLDNTPSDNMIFGEQLSENDLPFSPNDGNQVVGSEERKEMVDKNKVTVEQVSEAFIPKKLQRAIARIAKMMPKVDGKPLNVQYLYSADADGWFDRDTNTLYLALDSSKALQMVFGHEMTHAIKSMNTSAYDELKGLVKEFLGADFDKAVDATEKFYNAHGVNYDNKEDYEEEVIADGIGTIINDLNLTKGIALRMSHPLLAAFHDVLMKIRLAFRLSDDGTYEMLTHAVRTIEKAYVDTAKGTFNDNQGESGEHVAFSLREKPEPKKKGVGYKVFFLKDGKLYPPMVANPNGAATPVGVWLDADAAPIAGESKTGRPQVKQGGKGTQGGSGKLAYRPGWHLGVIPYALQFNRKDAEGNKTLFPKDFVFAEVEYAADVDYQKEANEAGINPSGKYQHSLAGLKHLPTDGYYMYRTNPNPETDPWVITGAMKVNRILTRAEQADLVKKAGRTPQIIQEGDNVTDDVVAAINHEIANAPKFSLKVYHGSGADFDEFDFDHMGEGAGSQAFGWGGYVTSSKKIGKSYAQSGMQTRTMMVKNNGKWFEFSEGDPMFKIADEAMYLIESEGLRGARNFANRWKEAADTEEVRQQWAMVAGLLNNHTKADFKSRYPSHLYEVEIPDDNGNNYLDWEKPLTDEQKDKIAKQLKKLKIDVADYERRGFSLDSSFGDVYYFLTNALKNTKKWQDVNAMRATSKFLASLDFTGIKYPAGTIMGGAENGDTNYVIFKPEDMIIASHTKFSLRDAKPVRFEVGKSLSEEEKKEALSTLKDSYKENNVPFHLEENANGKERRVYEPTANDYMVSDITGRSLRYYITLPDGRIAHPTEVYPNVSNKEVETSLKKRDVIGDEAKKLIEGNIKKLESSVADISKVISILSQLQALQHETTDVGYGFENPQSYNYKTGIFTSNANQAVDYVVRRMRRKEEISNDVVDAVKKAVNDSYGMVDNLIDGLSNSVKPSGVGVFGNIYNQFRGKAKEAIGFLKNLGSGEATAALHHHTIGDISLVWGDKKTGLAKILRKHPEVVDDLQSIIDGMEVVSETDNRIKLESPTHFAVVSKEFKGEPRDKWLLTAFEKKESLANGKSMDTATTSLGGDTALSQTKESAAKIGNSSGTSKENGKKFSLRDEEYLKAVEDGDMEKAQKMVNEAAEKAGYTSGSDYQGTSAFNGSAPWGNGYFLTKEERKEAWDNGEFEGESTLGDYINDGIDGGNLEELTNSASYRAADNMRKKAILNVRNAINGKAKTIKMYRSVPSSVKEGSFRNGDWITPSKDYAKDNANIHGWGKDYRIIEQEVPVDEVWFDGNDIAEWGYGREEDYANDTDFAYKNTKNNKKLFDAVTYDDNGNVIPLSKRFDEADSDIRFSLAGLSGAANSDKAEGVITRLQNFNIALKMVKDGKDAKAIKMATGWEKGADGKWRYEIADANITEYDIPDNIFYNGNIAWNRWGWSNPIGTLYDILDAPGLFKFYPELKDIKVSLINSNKYNGGYVDNYKRLLINKDLCKMKNGKLIVNESAKKTIVHEVQHVIQDIEGFAKGGNADMFVDNDIRFAEFDKKVKEQFGKADAETLAGIIYNKTPEYVDFKKKLIDIGWNDFFKALRETRKYTTDNEFMNWYHKFVEQAKLGSAWEQYHRLGGEVEARNVQKRMGMSAEERRNSLAAETEDVPRSEQDIRFSLKDPDKTMVGVHNISQDKLLKAIKQGGLANPSVAVIDASKQQHEGYGEISLVMPSSKIAKRTGRNAGTWQGDAWTPTYPQVERQMDSKGSEKASSDVMSVPREMQSAVRRDIDRWLDNDSANSGMAYLFLHERGEAPQMKKTASKYDEKVYNELRFVTAGDFNISGIGESDTKKVLGMYIDARYGGDRKAYEQSIKEWLDRNKAYLDKGKTEGFRYAMAKKNLEMYDEYGFNYDSVQRFVSDVQVDGRKGGKADIEGTLKSAEDYITEHNLENDFEKWIGDKEEQYGIKEVIFDGFTPSGKRRYVANTLQNVSKIMKKQGRNGSSSLGFSFNNFAAKLMSSYGKLDEIRSKKGLLTSNHEDLDKFREKWGDVFLDLGKKCQPDSENPFDDYGMERLSEAALQRDPQAYLKKEYNVDFSDKDLKRLNEMIKAIKDEYPAMYFETKFERPVMFDEFSAAVVPSSARKEVKDALDEAGVPIFEYDTQKDGDRKRAFDEAVNSGGNIMFSLRYDDYEKSLADWKKRNGLAKDAKRPEMPQQLPNESKFDFMKRVNKYLGEKALWNTAPTYEGHLLFSGDAVGYLNSELQRGSVLARIAVQDSMLPIRIAQDGIMRQLGLDKIGVGEDAYTAENRSHGKAKNEFEEYNQVYLQPLRKAYHAMKKALGDSYDNVKVYMMSKHGLERNAFIAFRDALKKDFTTRQKGKKDIFDADGMQKAYNGYKSDVGRILNDANYAAGTIDYATYRQNDDAIRTKYAPSYPEFRYDDDGNVRDYAGLSALYSEAADFEVAAAENVKSVENAHSVEAMNLWDATNAATKKILKDSYQAGMMGKSVYDYVRDMYSNYIPLRGWDGTSADQVWDYIGGGRGAFNQTMKKAGGRKSIADDPIAYIENMAESGILLNNKNYVKQHLLLLAENHPTKLLTVSKAWYVKSKDAFGNDIWTIASPNIPADMTDPEKISQAIAQFDKDMRDLEAMEEATQKRGRLDIEYPQTHGEEREHEVRVLRDGEEYVIYVNGDPQLAQAMNNARAQRVRERQSGIFDRGLAWLGRKMAAAYTSLSPLFIPANFTRDLTMTLASTAIREDARYNYLLRKNFLTNWNSLPLVMKYQSGELRQKVEDGTATKKEQMFYDFMMNGGETGFVSTMEVEDFKRKIQEELRDMDRMVANPKRIGHAIMDTIELLNRAIEDSNRFLVYMTSIEYGRPIEEAINNAKDVTLNFNRKGTGEYGWQIVRNVYLFVNPAIQSLQTLGALAKHHPYKFTAVTSLWLASGVLVPAVNNLLLSMFGGDDDKDKYWSFSKWDRRNNFIMWIPFTKNFIKIPLAQEFRGFYAVGDFLASMLMGGEKAKESWKDYALDFIGQVVDMSPLDPTGYDGEVAISLMPNAVRPFFELAFNVDFTGKPLFKDSEFNKYDPNFTKAYAGTPDWLVRTSRFVNSLGNPYPDVQQNAIDRFGNPRYNLNNPAVVDHVLSSYLGGAYTFGSQAIGVLTKALNSDSEVKMADIPLLSRFAANPDDRPVAKKQGDVFWDMKEQQDRTKNTLSKLKKEAKSSGDYSTLEYFFKSDQYAKFKENEPKIKQYEEDKKKENAEKDGEEYKPHKSTGGDIYKKHATSNDDFEDMKMDLLWKKVSGFKTAYDGMVALGNSQSKAYYNQHSSAIDAADEVSTLRSSMNDLKKEMLTDGGKDGYNAEDMKEIRELRKQAISILESAAKTIQKGK